MLQNVPIQLNIIKGFEFVSQLRRASVIVSETGNRDASIFVKGAPECMRDICRAESCKLMKALYFWCTNRQMQSLWIMRNFSASTPIEAFVS